VKKLKDLGRAWGLHPFAAVALFAVDWLLFGEEVATGGVGWVISLPVGLMLGLATILIQRRAYKDSRGVATAKGLVAGVLTAIPTPLASLGMLPMAAFGAIGVVASRNRQMTPAPVSSPTPPEPKFLFLHER
jgi:hypothetical protein